MEVHTRVLMLLAGGILCVRVGRQSWYEAVKKRRVLYYARVDWGTVCDKGALCPGD